MKKRQHQNQYQEDNHLNQRIQQQRHATAAHARQRKLKRCLLGRFNGKLVLPRSCYWVRGIHSCPPHDGSANAAPTGSALRNWSSVPAVPGFATYHTRNFRSWVYYTVRRPRTSQPFAKIPSNKDWRARSINSSAAPTICCMPDESALAGESSNFIARISPAHFAKHLITRSPQGCFFYLPESSARCSLFMTRPSSATSWAPK